ncbi:MAG: hypothetical protein ACXVEC_14390 [Nocardioides sp.]
MAYSPAPPDRPTPGPVPGALAGVAGGLVVGLVLAFGGLDVGVAVGGILLGLGVVLLAAAPSWRWFAIALLTLASLTTAGTDLLVWRY